MSDSPAPYSQMRLLLIDDDVDFARSILTALPTAKLQSQHCTIAQFRPELLTRFNPHLVLLHLSLPDIGSASLCPQIRAQSRVPIMILSQRTRREDQFHFLNLGADDFVAMRPPDMTLMLVRVLTLLRRAYEYDRPQNRALHPQEVRSQIPSDWVTCDACGYMGPNHRFEKTDSLGKRLLSCPNCNYAKSLSFRVQ